MAQKDAKTTDGSERASGYIREVADAAKAGVDKASDYLEGVADQVELVTGAMNETQEQVAAFGSRRIDDVWADTLRYTKRRPGMALLIAGAVGLTARRWTSLVVWPSRWDGPPGERHLSLRRCRRWAHPSSHDAKRATRSLGEVTMW